jgi:hypothetical protein
LAGLGCTNKDKSDPTHVVEEAESDARAAAEKMLRAFQAKDIETLASMMVEEQRAEFREEAAEILEKANPLFDALRAWDGGKLELRYAGLEALVLVGPADGRFAVLTLEQDNEDNWLWKTVRYSSREDFDAWGEPTPGDKTPRCHEKENDQRLLPSAWAARGGAPKDAVACRLGTPEANRYSFELGSSPQEAAEAWRAHLRSHGWTLVELEDSHGIRFEATNAELRLTVFTSLGVKDLGWTTVTVDP